MTLLMKQLTTLPRWQRRGILFLSELQCEDLANSTDGVNLLRQEGLAIISLEKWTEQTEGLELVDNRDPMPSTFFVITPFDQNKYVQLEDSRNSISILKYMYAQRLFQLLGARVVRAEQIVVINEGKETTIEVAGKYEAVKGDVNIKKVDVQKLKNAIEFELNYNGSAPNISEATKFLNEHSLGSDSVLSNLVTLRTESQNEIKNLDLKIALTQDLQSTFDFVGKIKFPVGCVSTSFKEVVSSKLEFILKLRIEF
jgi:hypothetical protein